ncbi:MAG: nucleotidyltransferase domain-containing protein [Bacteroidota bacterium]
MNHLIKRFVNDVKNQYKNKIYKIIMFDSYVQVDNRSDSDIDMLIIWKGNRNKGAEKIENIAFEYLLEEDLYFSIKVLNIQQYNELKDKGNPFIENIEKEGICFENL